MTGEYENMRRISYGEEGATFIPICKECGRIVKPDASVYFNGLGEVSKRPNATCSKHGRINMIFEGYI